MNLAVFAGGQCAVEESQHPLGAARLGLQLQRHLPVQAFSPAFLIARAQQLQPRLSSLHPE